jgi:Mn-containing catalase
MLAVHAYNTYKNVVDPVTRETLRVLRNRQVAREKYMKAMRTLHELRRRGNARATRYAEYVKTLKPTQ